MKTSSIRECIGLVEDACGAGSPAGLAESELKTLEASNLQARVADFHRACGLPVASEPTVGTPEQRELRVRLMLEELLEFAEAAGVEIVVGDAAEAVALDRKPGTEIQITAEHEPDLAKMLHELGDTQYVTSDTAVELGLPLPEAFSEVHGANMRKVGPDGKVVMVNGKVMKPEGWVPADVAKLLNPK